MMSYEGWVCLVLPSLRKFAPGLCVDALRNRYVAWLGGEWDQLDLAELIVAAWNLYTDANDYRLDGDAKQVDLDAKDAADREILVANPLDVFAEDAIWQEFQIDSVQRYLLATTAVTRHEIAEVAGVETRRTTPTRSSGKDFNKSDTISAADDDNDILCIDRDENVIYCLCVRYETYRNFSYRYHISDRPRT